MYSSQSIRSGDRLNDLFQWGDHVCHFYHSADELGEVLVPYFKAGLERNERCLWITTHPYRKDRAASEMSAAVSDFDRRTAAGQIQILDQDEWYAKLGALSTTEKVQCWLSQKEEALALGYAGLRGSGNTSPGTRPAPTSKWDKIAFSRLAKRISLASAARFRHLSRAPGLRRSIRPEPG